ATRGIDFGALGGSSDGASSGGDAADELWPVRTDSGGAGSSPEGKPESEKVKYETVNGLTIRAIVWRPRGEASKSPVIILAHDGLRGIGVAARRLAEELAGVGYIVFAPEFRGQGRSEGKVEWAQGEVFDLLAAVEEAKKIEGADTGRIGLVGAGHGGAVVLIALARAEGVACAAAISPPTDLTGLARERHFVRELKLMRVPLDLSDSEELMKRSPLYYAGGIGVPVQVLHGVRDKLVPVRFAEEYLSAVKNRGKEITLQKYGLSDEGLVSKLSVYRVDLHNFLAPLLKPPGWKVAKGGKKGGPPSEDDDKRGKRPDRRRRH
ncbi:MAG: alpha/beta hydrolase family protein, partial [Planctomycetota bacterium]